MNDLINRVESKVSDINENVRKCEAAYRINFIDENIDFNNVTEVCFFEIFFRRGAFFLLLVWCGFSYFFLYVCPYQRFKIANGRRELISEKTFTYLKKNTNGTVEVIVMFFTDMVLITRIKRLDNFLLFKPPIPLEAAVFLDKPDVPGEYFIFPFFIFYLGCALAIALVIRL